MKPITFYRWQNTSYPIFRGLYGRFWSDVKTARSWQDFRQVWDKFPRIVRVKRSFRYL